MVLILLKFLEFMLSFFLKRIAWVSYCLSFSKSVKNTSARQTEVLLDFSKTNQGDEGTLLLLLCKINFFRKKAMKVKLNSVATPDFVAAVAASACHALSEPSADPQAPSPWAWLLCKKKTTSMLQLHNQWCPRPIISFYLKWEPFLLPPLPHLKMILRAHSNWIFFTKNSNIVLKKILLIKTKIHFWVMAILSDLVPAEGVCGLTQGHFNVIISLCLHQVFQGPLVPWGIAPKIVLLMVALELVGFPDQRGWVIRIRNVNQSPTLFFVHWVQDNVWKACWLVVQSGMWWDQISSCLNQMGTGHV